MKILGWLLFALTCTALGQQKPATSPVPTPAPATTPLPPGVTITDPAYPLPLAERDKIRDLQHENDQIEIENQKMLVKIEQNKAEQVKRTDMILDIALQFAQSRHIDLTRYELDPSQIRFVKKTPPKP